MSQNIFEQAVRQKLRFESPKGLLTVEDLYDLPLTGKATSANLDDIAKALHRSLKDEEVSFVAQTTAANLTQALKLELVKYVIADKLAARDAYTAAAAKAEQKQKILAVIAKKQDGALEAASLEDLQAMLAAL